MTKLSYEVVTKAVTWLILLEQIRQQATDEADVHLTESIRRHGVLQPIGARPKGDKEGKEDKGEVVWGHRRLRCAIAAGLSEVPCVILDRDMSESDFLALQVVENTARESLSPFDLWQGCVRLMDANAGWSQKDLAKAISLDASSITRIMSASKCVSAVIESFKTGALSQSDVYAISKVEESAQASLLALKLSGAANRNVLEQAGRKTRAPKTEETVKTSSLRIALGEVVITVKGADLTLGLVAEMLDKASKEAEKAKTQGLNAKTAERVWKDRSAKKTA
ncbi:Chromosome-partitioning protein Spo0J [Gemmata obscuriglobus]|nr:ParB/RepB/Spo0J family partition protein [Gemmata obscuriglobus]QEG30313.1 Chromosome-partitioning protein Spo0J [Gemmata obscuriglobus]VTS09637.1 chromosome partitioning protein : ParB-like partition protein OS=Singulisphaera acidiphila (strain ATCC BAA-1392 / DSM 18658 / VKM B-2454 / MOB10) GN=Sinac_7619 PE=4 SV=1: ParBc [Gemmata obscuriglobus UQM 2246]